MIIRAAERSDITAVAEWNAAMAWETEHKRLDPDLLRRGVAAVFDEPRRGFYLVAERDGQPVGCLLVTYEWSDWRNGDFWWIQSVYVAPDARRGGVFRTMYGDVASRAKQAGAVGLRLYVETENSRAQRTYRELGMEECRYLMYEQML
ncbi:GNAT family N-acetyltransferase [Dyella monticola]|uniref:GNAT family N-acetyltransferase n=1 Tax=Dyella monticola TaxID=1927958 RepID=A0A370WUG1_9GAMM|nr:GNAT family N-acetyltransferase [Dyella monticola]